MGVGSVATRLLADFGADVIKIEDRIRIDTPRRLPIYKGEPARNFGEEVVGADPNRGGLFNNYCRNKLGVTINMRTEKGRALAERLIATCSVVIGKLCSRRHGALGPDLRAAAAAVPRRDLRPHERLRPLGPACWIPQLRTGRSGGERAFLHQRTCPAGSRPAGVCPTWTTRPPTTTRPLCCSPSISGTGPVRAPRSTSSAVEAGVNLLGPVLLDVTVNGQTTRRPDYPTGNRLEQPNAAPHGVYPARGRGPLGGHRRVRRRRMVRPGRRARGAGLDAPIPRFATQDGRFANQDLLDGQLAEWTRHPRARQVMQALQAAGCPCRRRAKRRGPQRRGPPGRRQAGVLRDGSPRHRPGPVRGHSDPLFLDGPGQLALGSAARRGQRLRLQTAGRPVRRIEYERTREPRR